MRSNLLVLLVKIYVNPTNTQPYQDEQFETEKVAFEKQLKDQYLANYVKFITQRVYDLHQAGIEVLNTLEFYS